MGFNEDVPEHIKYHDLMEELKKNKEKKGIQKYVAEDLIPVLINKEDQTLEKVVGLQDIKYGRSRTEKVEDVIEDYLKFREDQYEDDDELNRAMKDLRQRRIDLDMYFDEFDTVWMLDNEIEKKDRKF